MANFGKFLALLALVCGGLELAQAQFKNTLKSGETLWEMEWLISANRKCELILQSNRDLCVFNRETRKVVWNTGEWSVRTRPDWRCHGNGGDS